MKRVEIVVGKRYADGKGNVREVVADGDKFAAWTHQHDKDCIQWKQVERGKRGEKIGTVGKMTRQSMAYWSKSVQPGRESSNESSNEI